MHVCLCLFIQRGLLVCISVQNSRIFNGPLQIASRIWKRVRYKHIGSPVLFYLTSEWKDCILRDRKETSAGKNSKRRQLYNTAWFTKNIYTKTWSFTWKLNHFFRLGRMRDFIFSDSDWVLITNLIKISDPSFIKASPFLISSDY